MKRKLKQVLKNEIIHVDDTTTTTMMKTTATIFVMMTVHTILFRFEKEVFQSIIIKINLKKIYIPNKLIQRLL